MTTITTRAGKGSPLLNSEVDANFTNLNDDKVETSGDSMTGNLSFGDNNKVILGSGSDLQLYHDGDSSYISHNTTGTDFVVEATSPGDDLILRAADDVNIRANGNEQAIVAVGGGAVTLYYDNAARLATTSTGIDVTGSITTDGLTSVGGFISIGADGAGDDFRFYGDTSGRYMEWVSSVDSLLFRDGAKALFGNGSDLQIYHDGSNSYIRDSGTGDLQIRASNLLLTDVDGTIMLDGRDNGKVSLHHNGSEKIATTSTGIDVTGNIAVSSAGARRIDISNTSLADTGEMASLQWDANADLTFQGRASDGTFKANWYRIEASDSDGLADAHRFYTDSSVERMAITSTGIDVTGTAVTDGVTVAGNLSVDGGTIKLDGNHPNGTNNVGLGNATLANASGANGYSVAVGTSALNGMTTGGSNVGVGYNAGLSITSGANNIAIGSSALDAATTANFNVAIGSSALGANTTASNNTAVGYSSLTSNTVGSANVGIGTNALFSNQGGARNVAVGHDALRVFNAGASVQNTYNVAIGYEAMELLTTGITNVAVGGFALKNITTHQHNTAVGYSALTSATNGPNTAVGYQALKLANNTYDNTAVGRAAMQSLSTGLRNTAMGNLSLDALTTGSHNVALGHEALTSATTSSNNTAVGSEALEDATTGGSNTAIGRQALASNTTASANTAVGFNALVSNISGSSNTAIGYRAGYSNTSGQELTVVGYDAALYSLANSTTAFGRNAMRGVSGASTGANNTGLGESALRDYTTALGNTAVGKNSMLVTTTGSNNVAVGYGSLDRNTTGYSNVMIGRDAGTNITTGHQNVAVGFEALRDTGSGAGNTAVGYEAGREITTAVNNTMLGYRAGHSTTAGNGRNTYIGFDAGRDSTGDHNSFFGKDAGQLVTSGGKNTIVGSYTGNGDSIDIRTSSNHIVLSDGDGNVEFHANRAISEYTIGNIKEYRGSVLFVNDTAYTRDIDIKNLTGQGNFIEVLCGYNHFYGSQYGAWRFSLISYRSSSDNALISVDDIKNQTSTGGGSWTFALADSGTTLRITKTAGTYVGSGYGFIIVRQIK